MTDFVDAGNIGAAPDATPDTASNAAVETTPTLEDSLGVIWDKKTSDTGDQNAVATDNVAADEQILTDQLQQDAQEPEAQAVTAIDAPNAWSADMKGKWADVPPDIQAYITERETEAHSQITRMGQEIAEGRPVRELLGQNMDLFDAAGVSVVDGLPMLLNAQRLLNENPLQGIAAIAQTFGIDLTQAFGPQSAQGDPQLGQLQSQVTQLQNQLHQRDNQNRMATAREEEARINEAKNQVQEWGRDKHYFQREDVRNMMGTLISGGQAQDLDTAYEAACHAIGEIRKDIADKAKAEQEAKARKAQTAAVKDAKKVAKSNLGSKAAGAPAKGGSPNDDDYLGDVFDRVVSG